MVQYDDFKKAIDKALAEEGFKSEGDVMAWLELSYPDVYHAVQDGGAASLSGFPKYYGKVGQVISVVKRRANTNGNRKVELPPYLIPPVPPVPPVQAAPMLTKPSENGGSLRARYLASYRKLADNYDYIAPDVQFATLDFSGTNKASISATLSWVRDVLNKDGYDIQADRITFPGNTVWKVASRPRPEPSQEEKEKFALLVKAMNEYMHKYPGEFAA